MKDLRWWLIASAWLLSAPALADPGPGNELAPLVKFFAGDWKCAGHFSNGKPISSRESFSPLLGGVVLRESHQDDPPFPYDAESLWGFDADAQLLTLTIHDNFGGLRLFTSKDWQGAAITFDEQPVMGKLRRQERFIYTRFPAGGYRMEYQVFAEPGGWKMGDVLDCGRSGS